MKRHLFAGLSLVFSLVQAVVLDPRTAGRGILRHVTEPQAIPASRPSGMVRLDFVCGGPVSVNTRLLFFDVAGTRISEAFMWPSLKMPTREEWGRPNVHAMALGAGRIPDAAKTVSVELSLTHEAAEGNEAPLFDLQSARLVWNTAPRGVKTANWFTWGEDVVFRGELPEGKKGLRVAVRDAEGEEVFRGDISGAEWRWRPPQVGFYTAAFSWLDEAGNAEPVVETYASCAHRTKGKTPIRTKFAEFPRSEQAFCVSPTPARTVDHAPPMFGFNVAPQLSQDLDEQAPFELIQLLGMNAFIRYHWFRWHEIERKGRGKYDWSSVDEALDRARKAGYGLDRILVNAFGTPAWLTTAPKDLPAQRRPHLYAPKDMAPFHDFVKAFCTRYPEMKYLELWNEPHLPGYSIFWQKSSPEQFVELLKAGYTGAKEANPEITVLMGGVGMRYLPFYEQFVRLGGVDWYDQMDTHCGYDMRPFRAAERKAGVASKPYWEGEWHTVLYNCSAPEIPSEETCAYRMLTNMADLMHEGNTRVTGFGLCCGDHTPESARFFAGVEGIHQVSGLFRSRPYLEPRLAALALRTATDRFVGTIERRGAWAFAEDGSQRICAFASEAGTMAFAWGANPWMKTGDWAEGFAAVAAGRRILDWTGRPVSLAQMRPMRVYFILDPDLTAAARGVKLDHLDYTAYNFKAPKSLVRGGYAPLASPAWNVLTNGLAAAALQARFAADLQPEALDLLVQTRGTETAREVTFALDVVGKGRLDDVVEFKATREGTILKPRTPVLMGDIPPEFSPANVPLTKSTVSVQGERNTETWRIHVAMSDLYPFIHARGRALRLVVKVVGATGDVTWGAGWSVLKKPADFGILTPTGRGRVLAEQSAVTHVFGLAKVTPGTPARVVATSAEKGSGFTVTAKPVPGSTVRATMKVRGRGRIEAAAWPRNDRKRGLGRLNAGHIPLAADWKTFEVFWTLPADAVSADFSFFGWRDATLDFEVADFKLINE